MNAKDLHYSSHLPLLMRAVRETTGPVLELGTGWFSTPVLHWLCLPTQRRLVSYESIPSWFAKMEQFRALPWHEMHLVEDWDTTDIERPWDVAFIDHEPASRRKVDLRRLAPWARYIVVHDTCGRDEKHYHYADTFPLFKWNLQFDLVRPRTNVLSNLVDPSPLLSW